MSTAVDDLKKWIEEEKRQSELSLNQLREEKTIFSEILPDDEPVRCPKCSSNQVTAQKGGLSFGGAAVGGIIFGGAGLVAGGLGSSKVMLTCLKCGKQWKPGQGKSFLARCFGD